MKGQDHKLGDLKNKYNDLHLRPFFNGCLANYLCACQTKEQKNITGKEETNNLTEAGKATFKMSHAGKEQNEKITSLEIVA